MNTLTAREFALARLRGQPIQMICADHNLTPKQLSTMVTAWRESGELKEANIDAQIEYVMERQELK